QVFKFRNECAAKTTDSHQRCPWTCLVNFCVQRVSFETRIKDVSWSAFQNWSSKQQQNRKLKYGVPLRKEIKRFGCPVRLGLAPRRFPVMLRVELVIRRYILVACAASPRRLLRSSLTIVLLLVKVSKIK
ncbi:unnamed protein product, partial [Ixodes hexagonus]